jgi:hypothetical protein
MFQKMKKSGQTKTRFLGRGNEQSECRTKNRRFILSTTAPCIRIVNIGQERTPYSHKNKKNVPQKAFNAMPEYAPSW